jgi:hypothetical protein
MSQFYAPVAGPAPKSAYRVNVWCYDSGRGLGSDWAAYLVSGPEATPRVDTFRATSRDGALQGIMAALRASGLPAGTTVAVSGHVPLEPYRQNGEWKPGK